MEEVVHNGGIPCNPNDDAQLPVPMELLPIIEEEEESAVVPTLTDNEVAAARNLDVTIATFGLQPSTLRTHARTIVLWDGVSQHAGFPKYAQINSNTTNGQQLKLYFCEFANYLANTPVPMYFDADLKPRNADSTQCLSEGTVLQCFTTAKTIMHAVTSALQVWRDSGGDTDPVWYSMLYDGLKKCCRANMTKTWDCDEGVTCGNATVRPLYKKNHFGSDHEAELERLATMNWHNEDVSAEQLMTLEKVMLVLTDRIKAGCNKSSGNLLRLSFLCNGAGRGAEPRGLSWAMSSFDHKCQSLQMKWPQFKVSVITFLSFVMCLDLTDPTCAITCMMLHISMGFGLQRSPIDLTRGIAKFVFPEDQMKTSQTVTRNLSIAIRGTMPRWSPASFVNSVSTRSIRISTITDMMSCGRLTVPQICVCSGHASWH